jgi:hypothetical protein
MSDQWIIVVGSLGGLDKIVGAVRPVLARRRGHRQARVRNVPGRAQGGLMLLVKMGPAS